MRFFNSTRSRSVPSARNDLRINRPRSSLYYVAGFEKGLFLIVSSYLLSCLERSKDWSIADLFVEKNFLTD